MKKWRKEEGFTLVEMLIVLLIISVLILVTIPNVGKHFKTIDDKGCSAFVAMVQGQVEAYRVSEMKYPTMTELVDEGYLKNNETSCPSGEKFVILQGGQVVLENAITGEDGS